jgi:hypothetical protein
VVASDSDIGANVLFELIDPKGLLVPALAECAEFSCLVGENERAGWSFIEPEMGGSDSKREAPNDEEGLKGVMPPNPVD